LLVVVLQWWRVSRQRLAMSNRSSRNPSVLYGLLACSVLLNVALLVTRGSSGVPEGDFDDEIVEGDSAAPVAAAAAEAVAALDVGTAHAADSPPPEWAVLGAKVESSLARTFQLSAGADGDALASVYTRLFVWDIDMRRDLQAGDAVAVAWRKTADGLPEIAAASLKTSKLGKNVAAYRWKGHGDPYPSYWHLDGTEAPLRLKDSPLASYDQITSLLKDRPTHKGMDFKTPVGTEVISPRTGTVTRVNWNWGANGNCVEVRYTDGVLAKFLHLSENRVKEGQTVQPGQVIALTGNTGRSTAPHLHYQLDRGDKTLDPLDYHGTIRRTLSADEVAALKRDVAGFEKMLGEAVVR